MVFGGSGRASYREVSHEPSLHEGSNPDSTRTSPIGWDAWKVYGACHVSATLRVKFSLL